MTLTYRTRRRLTRLGIVGAIALIGLIIGWLCWVVWLEHYVVYTSDGVVLNFELDPQMPVGQVAAPPSNENSIEIYYNEGSNSVDTNRELTQLKGYHIDQSALTDLAGCRDRLGILEAGTAIMIDVKNIDGTFNYSSGLTEAPINGNVDVIGVDSLIRDINSGKFYTIARVPAFRDRNYGLNHVSSGLPLPGGYLWMDSRGCYWLNPADSGTLNWLIQITEELKLLGFDEVVFSEFRFPETDKIVYRQDKQEALKTALDTLLNTCGTSTFTLSFTVADPTFQLPEGRSRIYLEGVPADQVGATASRVTVTNPEVRLVFVSTTNDTRYDDYGVLRPIASADVLEDRS